jgi:hypothetical protein
MQRRPRRNHTPVFKSKVALATLMKRMGIEALYRNPKTTKKHPQHRVYPYLLRGLVIDRPNQVFAMDGKRILA